MNYSFKDYLKNAAKFMNESEEDELEAGVPGVDDEFELDSFEDEDGDGVADEEECEMVECPDCAGTGVVATEDGEEVPCETCGGEGQICIEDAEFDFDPETGVCPCCGCKLNLIEPEEDSLDGEVEDEEDLEDLETEETDDLDDNDQYLTDFFKKKI